MTGRDVLLWESDDGVYRHRVTQYGWKDFTVRITDDAHTVEHSHVDRITAREIINALSRTFQTMPGSWTHRKAGGGVLVRTEPHPDFCKMRGPDGGVDQMCDWDGGNQ